MVVTALLLLLAGPAEDAGQPASYQRVFKTSKTSQALEKCLIGELSDLGDPTLIQEQGSTVLMIRNGQDKPLLIQIEPPKVTITTRAPPETQIRVKRCV